MDFLLTPTRSYINYSLVTMVSVYKNHSAETELNFWFMQSDFEESDKKRISDFASKYNQKVFFIDVDESKYQQLLCKFDYNRWVSCVFYKLFAHELIPKSVSRIMYLEVDMVVTGELSDFYNLNFDNCMVIASRTSSNYKNVLSEPENEFDGIVYPQITDMNQAEKGAIFNSGAIILNLDKMRADGIDVNWYSSSISDWKKLTLFDQSILNVCFGSSVKLLASCKYNYKISYGAVGYFDRDNNRYWDKRKYKFIHLDGIKVIHFCGQFPTVTKPWDIYFSQKEIGSYEKNFFGLIPECADYFNTWWKYAELTPAYDDLYQSATINRASYRMFKKIVLDTNLEFCNQTGIESLTVPSWRNINSVLKNDDLNKFTKPRIYRCLSADIKNTLKNLPEDFIEERGFRLTVKHICSNGGEDEYTSVIQILEPNSPNAAIYRRYCGRPKKGTWSKWYRMATTDDIKIVDNDKINNLEERIAKLENICNIINNNLAKEKIENENIRKSLSYRIGRFITFIPRKIRDLFKKK